MPSYAKLSYTLAKGRTNIELREQFILADGVSQSMTAFKPRLSLTSASPSQNGSPVPTQGPIVKVIANNEYRKHNFYFTLVSS
jgi:hypothetical protein